MKEPTENEIQAAFFQWIDLTAHRHPSLQLCFAVPNGSHKSPAARALFRRTGLRPGVPDVHIPIPQGIYAGLWIEFKKKRGGRLSEAQKGWCERLTSQGHRVIVARSWVEAANEVITYLNLPTPKL